MFKQGDKVRVTRVGAERWFNSVGIPEGTVGVVLNHDSEHSETEVRFEGVARPTYDDEWGWMCGEDEIELVKEE